MVLRLTWLCGKWWLRKLLFHRPACHSTVRVRERRDALFSCDPGKKKVRRKPINFPDGPDRAAAASCNASIRARERCEVASGKCIRPLRCRRRNIVKEAAWSLGIRERAPTVYRLFLCHNLRHARNRETSVARAGSGAEGEKARPTSRPVSAVTLAALHWHRPVWHEVELGEGHPSKEPAVQRQRAQQWAWPRSASCC